ncbi:hypothetical protein KW795_00830 [Candidatus Microgenomates bacterium]|nr:hypothetical protein [Candidatus Microgenomates bacterium]
MTRDRIQNIIYIEYLNQDQKDAVQTCPKFNDLQETCLEDTQSIRGCLSCGLQAKYDPHIGVLTVKGSCPKL